MNNATQQFIEDAIKGGWYPKDSDNDDDHLSEYGLSLIWNCGDGEIDCSHLVTPQVILLDPLAWQAVGKTRGWIPECNCGKEHPGDYFMTHGEWRARFHMFIDHLADGKTIDEALQALN